MKSACERAVAHSRHQPPSSASPSPLSQQGRAQKSRLRRVSQSRMLAIPGATQWRHGARNRTTPIGKNFGGSRRLCTSVSWLVAGRPSRRCLHGSVKTEGCRPWVAGAETAAGVVVRSSNRATLPTHWRNRTPPPRHRNTQPARPSPPLAQPAQISHQRSPDLAASMRDISDGAYTTNVSKSYF